MKIQQTFLPFLGGFCFALILMSHQKSFLGSLRNADVEQWMALEHTIALEIKDERKDQEHPKQKSSRDAKDDDGGGENDIVQGKWDARVSKHSEQMNENTAGGTSNKSLNFLHHNSNSACSVFHTLPGSWISPMSTWNQHFNAILQASRHPEDKKDEFLWHDFTLSLLTQMTDEHRLMRAVKALPVQYWDRVGELLTLAMKRHRHLSQVSNQDTEKASRNSPGGGGGGGGSTDDDALDHIPIPRKINILIMGGSVTMGVQCSQNPILETSRFARRNCAWPNRLSQFLKELLPHDLVDIRVVTLGGTNTASASTIWEYWLYDGPFPDLVIHGYSTNDMHVLTQQEAILKNVTLQNQILNMNQDFVRKVLTPTTQSMPKQNTTCQLKPPLLLYYDDYIGNEQRGILDTMAFSSSLDVLSSYYGFGVISYAAAVRDLVYGDSDESWFSPHGWPERQIHPGMGMHITSMWLVAHYLLTIVTTYCNSISHASFNDSNGRRQQLRNGEILTGRPKSLPQSIPPKLNFNLTLDNISSQWRAEDISFTASSTLPNAHTCTDENVVRTNGGRSCSFSWVAGLERFLDKPKHLDKRMDPVVKQNQGWESTNDGNKLGFSAIGGVGSEFTLEFIDLDRPIVTLSFMVMTSYGEKWEGSTIHVDAIVVTNEEERAVGSRDIVGFHEKQTSETYVHKIDLRAKDNKGSKIGDTLKVKTRLVKGDTFKITGLAFCDH